MSMRGPQKPVIPHGEPAKTTGQQQEKRDAGFQRPPPPPPPGDPAEPRPLSRRRAATRTRDAARAAAHHARMRKRAQFSHACGVHPPQGGAHTAHGAAPAPRWPSRRLVSGSPQRLPVPARRLDAWTPVRVRGGFLLAGPVSGSGDGGGGVGSKRSGADCGGSEDGGGDGCGGDDGAAGKMGGAEGRRVRSKAETSRSERRDDGDGVSDGVGNRCSGDAASKALAAAAIASAVMAVAVGAAAVIAAASTTRRWRPWLGHVDGWAVVECVEGRVAENVDERVVGCDGGGRVNGGECVGCVEGGWWWRRRHSAGGAGGGGVNEAAALRWRRWRRTEKMAVVKAAVALR